MFLFTVCKGPWRTQWEGPVGGISSELGDGSAVCDSIGDAWEAWLAVGVAVVCVGAAAWLAGAAFASVIAGGAALPLGGGSRFLSGLSALLLEELRCSCRRSGFVSMTTVSSLGVCIRKKTVSW